MHSDRRGQLLFTSMQLVTRIIYIWRLTNVKPGHTNSRDGPLPLLRKFYRLFPRFDCIQIIYWPSWNKQTLIYLIFDLSFPNGPPSDKAPSRRPCFQNAIYR